MGDVSLEELKARKAARMEARRTEQLAREKEALELEEKYEEQGQKSGVDFVVVTTAVGNFVVSKPEFLTAKRFCDSKGDRSVEDAMTFVSPCILFPAKEALGATFMEHGGLIWRLANASLALYGADEEAFAGK